MFYVYELRNANDEVEYIGCTMNLKNRLYDHTQRKPKKYYGIGKFYGRDDLTLVIQREFENKHEALRFEGEHKIRMGFKWAEHDNSVLNGYKVGNAVSRIIRTCPKCGMQIKGPTYFRHLKNHIKHGE